MLTIEETKQKMATFRYRRILATYPSESKPGLTYKLRRAAGGELQCSCIKWMYSRDEPKTCNHTIRFEASREARPNEV